MTTEPDSNIGRRAVVVNKNRHWNGREVTILAVEYHQTSKRGKPRLFYRAGQRPDLYPSSTYLFRPEQLQVIE